VSDEFCPFCSPNAESIFRAGRKTLGLWDKFPVSKGHALLVTKRHVATWFETTEDERRELLEGLELAKKEIEAQYSPQGYNIGVNVGEAAGQTVPHVHVHLIPRYAGDVPNPTGGVRGVIPSKADYTRTAEPASEPTAAPDADALLRGSPHTRNLIEGGGEDPFLPHLVANLELARQADLAVAFVLQSGMRLLEGHLEDLLARGGRLRLLTGDYMDATDPAALSRLLDLREEHPGQVELRIFEARGADTFHSKAYLFFVGETQGVAYVGSSNLTATALKRGVEWNYRVVTSREQEGFAEVCAGFEALFQHKATRRLDHEWVEDYRGRRRAPSRPIAKGSPPSEAGDQQDVLSDVEQEPLEAPPEPHRIQREALAALEATRVAGNEAGLVVLATGLGKTWLSAFDSSRPEFKRILFVAHREEILNQALKTFRRIRPEASLGLFTGKEKTPNVDVLFASIQTLGRSRHLERFAEDHFDYVVVDEFHHAASKTYTRLIDYFSPRFMLGLTATPERTDGARLLALCQENEVYKCDLVRGIEETLLSPFHYFGVPDDVDYSTIPWRTRRETEALTECLATQKRAQNALEEYTKRAGERTLGFCCSTAHADFMAEYFRGAGVAAVAVHSDKKSAPRTSSLERLRAGDLSVVFAVDMFNEGVDLPTVDTVLMLRPTKSKIVWLQQFGRGLRWLEGKTLTVIDYIGNHRVFLTGIQALLGLGGGDPNVKAALDRYKTGDLKLPPGCEVTYELEAVEVLASLLRLKSHSERQAAVVYYADFKERNGVRPSAVEAFHDGFNPKSLRQIEGSWLRFVGAQGDLGDGEAQIVLESEAGEFLQALETTQMSKSYKMLVLLGLLNRDALPGALGIDDLATAVRRVAGRSAKLRADLGVAFENRPELLKLLEKNPIPAWTGGKGTKGKRFFRYEEGSLKTTFALSDDRREDFQTLARELVEWRLADYLQRSHVRDIAESDKQFVCKVSHASGRPILFLPDRAQQPDVPRGWTEVVAEGERYNANFVKIALNVVRRTGDAARENVLPELMRNWFGASAGQPGTLQRVQFELTSDGWIMRPLAERAEGPELWRTYLRAEIPGLFGLTFNANWRQGVILRDKCMFLFVTLEKGDLPEGHRYGDRFLDRQTLEWESQRRTKPSHKAGKAITHQAELGMAVHLFVRKHSKIGGRGAPFNYLGPLKCQTWKGERPIQVRWGLAEPLPDRLWNLFGGVG
jgi:superfamily II DNA or RNA helicase/diadenosine tetraphosphate (Ap4A) HIT family hydrolase